MAAQTSSELDGFFKTQFVDPQIDLVPDWAILGGTIPFDAENKLGGAYTRNVILSMPHGVTFCDAAQDTTLNDPVPIYTADASLDSDEFWLRMSIAQGLLNRASSTKQAFASIMTPIVKKMEDATNFYREMTLLHGGRHIGLMTSMTNPAAGTTATVTFANSGASATFASGLWAQMEQAKIDFYDAAADGGTKINTGGPITVTSVDVSAGTVAVSGDNTSLTAMYNSGTFSLYYAKPIGADGKWFTGMRSIVGHTSGSLFGINASNYTLWKGNTFDAGSVKATFSTFVKAAAKTLPRGGKGTRKVLISHATWTDLDIDSLLYRYDTNKKGGELDQGVESYTYRCATGTIDFVMHPMMFPSEAFMYDPGVFSRIGSTDATWTIPGEPGEAKFFVRNENKTSFQLRRMYDQALFCSDLSPNCLISNINNNTVA
jgi:hypothetical protein